MPAQPVATWAPSFKEIPAGIGELPRALLKKKGLVDSGGGAGDLISRVRSYDSPRGTNRGNDAADVAVVVIRALVGPRVERVHIGSRTEGIVCSALQVEDLPQANTSGNQWIADVARRGPD